MKNNGVKRQRGRPRGFDEQHVLEAASGVFWQAGYSAASLDDLAAAARVTRPSLYTALGDKKSMYLRALGHFGEHLRAQLADSLSPEHPLVDGLLHFYRASIDLYLSGDEAARGCLVMCTAPAEAVRHEDIRTFLAGIFRTIDDAFAARFDKAVAQRELATGTDTQALARLASAVLQSLALRARAGAQRADLEAMAQSAVRLVDSCATPQASRRRRQTP